VRNRKLIVNDDEARIVVDIYRRYLALKSVHALRDELADVAGTASTRPMPETHAAQPNWSKIQPSNAVPTIPPQK
jgi:hypothetical protein